MTNLQRTKKLIKSILDDSEEDFGLCVDEIEYIKSEVETVLSDLERIESRANTYAKELNLLKIRTKEKDNKEYIQNLENKIKTLEANIKSDKKIALPIIDETSKEPLDEFILIKEVKVANYMNSLIEYLSVDFLNTLRGSGEKNLVLVLDPLNDSIRITKYNKHGFNINGFNEYENVFITNLGITEISECIDFSIYKRVVVIDRYRTLKLALRRQDVDIYYLIDSQTDIIDYNLDNTKCVIYAVNPGICKYNINPNIDSIELEGNDRTIQIGLTTFMKRLATIEI